MNDTEQDRIFAQPQPVADFVFDEKVAAVFTDMINRSVPGYATIISMIGMLAERYCTPGSNLYDLGCSLGGASLAMRHQISHQDYTLYAVDNSQAMIDRFRKTVPSTSADDSRIQLVCADIGEVEMSNASVVVLNFTLQFIAPERRDVLMEKVWRSLRPGGILILSEKICFPEPQLNELMIDMYHQFKEAQGYSRLEISQKRAALENVLLPESLERHKQRLDAAGFQSCDVWFQCFNFASLVAFK